MNKQEVAVLEAHRMRVAEAKTFEEFKDAQLDLLDYLIDSAQSQNNVFETYIKKYDKWSKPAIDKINAEINKLGEDPYHIDDGFNPEQEDDPNLPTEEEFEAIEEATSKL